MKVGVERYYNSSTVEDKPGYGQSSPPFMGSTTMYNVRVMSDKLPNARPMTRPSAMERVLNNVQNIGTLIVLGTRFFPKCVPKVSRNNYLIIKR